MNVRINGQLFSNPNDAGKYLVLLASRGIQVKIEPHATRTLGDLLSCDLSSRG